MSQYLTSRESENVDQAEGGELEATGGSTTGQFESGEAPVALPSDTRSQAATPVDRDLPADSTQGSAPSGGASSGSGSMGYAGGANLEPQYPDTPASRTHTVAEGETLSSIAQQYFGDASSATRIFEANQDKLDNPDLIYPGQELAIPE